MALNCKNESNFRVLAAILYHHTIYSFVMAIGLNRLGGVILTVKLKDKVKSLFLVSRVLNI